MKKKIEIKGAMVGTYKECNDINGYSNIWFVMAVPNGKQIEYYNVFTGISSDKVYIVNVFEEFRKAIVIGSIAQSNIPDELRKNGFQCVAMRELYVER